MVEPLMLPPKAYVTLQVLVSETSADVRVNDIPVFRNQVPGNVIVEVPVNHAVLDGDNSLSILAKPLPDADAFAESAEVQATLFVRVVGAARENRQLITGINFRPTAKPDPGAKPTPGAPTDPTTAGSPGGRGAIERGDGGGGAVLLRRSIPVAAPFARWAWLAGTKINSDERTMNSLLDEYLRFQRALEHKDTRTVTGMTALRARDLAQAYGLGGEEAGHQKLGILRRLEDPQRKVDAFRIAGMRMDVYGDGRLARIVDEEGDGPIAFLIGKGDVAEYVKAGYFRDERGRWLMVQ